MLKIDIQIFQKLGGYSKYVFKCTAISLLNKYLENYTKIIFIFEQKKIISYSNITYKYPFNIFW